MVVWSNIWYLFIGLSSPLLTQTDKVSICKESHQWLAGTWKRRLSCHTGRQEVGRCRTTDESQGTCNVTRMPLLSSNKAEPILALKLRGDVTRSPKQGYQWPHKKDSCLPKFILKKILAVGMVAAQLVYT